MYVVDIVYPDRWTFSSGLDTPIRVARDLLTIAPFVHLDRRGLRIRTSTHSPVITIDTLSYPVASSNTLPLPHTLSHHPSWSSHRHSATTGATRTPDRRPTGTEEASSTRSIPPSPWLWTHLRRTSKKSELSDRPLARRPGSIIESGCGCQPQRFSTTYVRTPSVHSTLYCLRFSQGPLALEGPSRVNISTAATTPSLPVLTPNWDAFRLLPSLILDCDCRLSTTTHSPLHFALL